MQGGGGWNPLIPPLNPPLTHMYVDLDSEHNHCSNYIYICCSLLEFYLTQNCNKIAYTKILTKLCIPEMQVNAMQLHFIRLLVSNSYAALLLSFFTTVDCSNYYIRKWLQNILSQNSDFIKNLIIKFVILTKMRHLQRS